MQRVLLYIFLVLSLSPGKLLLASQITSNVQSLCSPMVEYQGKMYFCAEHPRIGKEVHVTDGSEFGTRVLRDIDAGPGDSTPRGFFKLKGYLYFFAENTDQGESLWRTDGTKQGTQWVTSISHRFNYSPSKIVSQIGDRVYFEGVGDGYSLFVTGGRAEDTHQIDVTVINGVYQLYENYSSTTYAVHDNELYVISAQTLYHVSANQSVSVVYSGLPYDDVCGPPTRFTGLEFLGKMLIEADGEIWLSDGTKIATKPFKVFPANQVTAMSVVGNKLIYENGPIRRYCTSSFPDGEYAENLALIATDGQTETRLITLSQPAYLDIESFDILGRSQTKAWFTYFSDPNIIAVGTSGSLNTTHQTQDFVPSQQTSAPFRSYSPSNPMVNTIVEYQTKLFGYSSGAPAFLNPYFNHVRLVKGLNGSTRIVGATQRGVVSFTCVPHCYSPRVRYEIGLIDGSGTNRLLTRFSNREPVSIAEDIFQNSDTPRRPIYLSGDQSYIELKNSGVWHTNGTVAGTYLLKTVYDDGTSRTSEPGHHLISPAIDLLLNGQHKPKR